MTATSPLWGRGQLCRPHGSHHPRTEEAAKAALTAVASESGIMAHSCTQGSQETLTTFANMCEPEGEQLKEDCVKSKEASRGGMASVLTLLFRENKQNSRCYKWKYI